MKLKKDEKLKLFQSHLREYYPECSEREQEDPEALYIVEKMLETCGSERSLKITLHILRNMKQKDLTASLERDEQHKVFTMRRREEKACWMPLKLDCSNACTASGELPVAYRMVSSA
ncbi:hypothetical protein SKAU_G00423470 [Synaphobranchus kaupii]|uniref:Pyrin domain-containing protein n=1 Tax=Synaphobranchus kaupii TaxID=118154 RepID=A0A9Q1E5D7_SYNKA|nr:hypothetical protein SKAU_G00423470 [Synaphobranchus kaupii]